MLAIAETRQERKESICRNSAEYEKKYAEYAQKYTMQYAKKNDNNILIYADHDKKYAKYAKLQYCNIREMQTLNIARFGILCLHNMLNNMRNKLNFVYFM